MPATVSTGSILAIAAQGAVVSTLAFLAVAALLGRHGVVVRRGRYRVCGSSRTPGPAPAPTAHRFRCPISLEDVVGLAGVTAAGQAYSPPAIVRWMAERASDPLTGVRLDPDVVGVWLCRFETEADLCAARGRVLAAACAACPCLALSLESLDTYVRTMVARLAAVRGSAAWRRFCIAVCCADAADVALAERLVALRQQALGSGLALPPEHLFIGVAISAANVLRPGAVFTDVSFAGARVTGVVRDVTFVRCDWTAVRFAGCCRFLNCAFLTAEPEPEPEPVQ
jgi:hypothetical protein